MCELSDDSKHEALQRCLDLHCVACLSFVSWLFLDSAWLVRVMFGL